jgi:hypothetical protein
MVCALTKYYFDDIIKNDGLGGACSTHGSDQKFRQISALRFEGKIPLGKTRGRWDDHI